MAGDSHLGASAMTGTTLNVVSFLFLGFFLGMRHATDADHVVAIATIVSRERSVAGSALIGAAWGVGHTRTVMAPLRTGTPRSTRRWRGSTAAGSAGSRSISGCDPSRSASCTALQDRPPSP